VCEPRVVAHPAVEGLLQKRLQGVRDGFRQNVVLLGPPGSGKTSTVFSALATVPPEFLIIYWEGRREPWDLWVTRCVTAVLQGILGFRTEPLNTATPQELLRHTAAIAPQTSQVSAELLAHLKPLPHERIFRQVLELPQTACAETQRPGVLVWDEFHHAESLGVHRPFHELGKLIMVESSLLYLLISSQPLQAQRIVRERLNLLFGGFEVVTLDGLEPLVAETWLRDQCRPRRLPDALAAFLAWLTAGHLWSLSTLAAAMARQPGRGECSPAELIRLVAEELADGRRPLAHWCLQRLREVEQARTSTAYVHLLLTLAGRRSTLRVLAQATHQAVSETSRQLGRLVEWGLVTRQGEVYMSDSPLWSFWLRQVFQVRRHATVTTVAGMTQRVTQQLEADWHAFYREHTRAPFQRFLGLLGQFQNELVRVDNRRVRLPQFTQVEREALGAGTHRVIAQPATGLPWLYWVKESHLREGDVVAFTQRSHGTPQRVGARVVVGLEDCEPAALLLAKASRLWVWHQPTLQALHQLYRLPALGVDP